MNGHHTAHHIDNAFGDCHAQPGSLDSADSAGFFTSECFKDCFLKFFTHTNAVILNPEFKVGKICGRGRLLDNPEADRTACRRELDCVGQNVQQHLIQAELISDNILMGYVLCINEQVQLL